MKKIGCVLLAYPIWGGVLMGGLIKAFPLSIQTQETLLWIYLIPLVIMGLALFAAAMLHDLRRFTNWVSRW